MRSIDQHIAHLSIKKALDTDQELVDNRNEVDYLDFLVRFSSLLNYFNSENQLSGEWDVFLLKDPVFLTAHISKTNVKQYESHFQKNISILEKESSKPNAAFKTSEKIRTAAVEVFNLLFDVYSELVHWTYFMQHYPKDYLLKKFVLQEVKESYSPILWSLLWLRNQLYNRSMIQKPKVLRPYTFEDTDQYCWTVSKGLTPSWEILRLNELFQDNSPHEVCNSLHKVGDRLLSFLKQLVVFSLEDYKKLNLENALYPDTTLLRTFTALLKPYKKQFNSLTKKHLDYYYQSILKQESLGIQPDSVFVNLTLAKNELLALPVNTHFVGGAYTDGSPILFENNKETPLNPALITNAYTLSKSISSSGMEVLYQAEQAEVGTIRKSASGQVSTWDTFGTKESDKVTFGFVMGSPLLLLKEGERQLTVQFTFLNEIEPGFLESLSFFLSTKEGWLQVQSTPQQSNYVKAKSCTFQFDLQPKDPAIEPFATNPDGLSSEWSQFKLEFDEVHDFSAPIEIEKVSIEVDVKSASEFVLSNDLGALDPSKPFQPLGPTPLDKGNFFIGSTEVFSKPLDSLELRYNWSNLPPNFFFYYFEYTLVLIADYLKNLVETELPYPPESIVFYDNNSFKVDFYAGGNKAKIPSHSPSTDNPFSIWTTFPLRNVKQSNGGKQCLFTGKQGIGEEITSEDLKLTKKKKDAARKTLLDTIQSLLKDIHNELDNLESLFDSLAPTTIFKFSEPKQKADGEKSFKDFFDPDIQLGSLKLSNENASGFIKMQLVSPEYGFGSEVFSKVVTTVAMFNGAQMVKENGKIEDMVTLNTPNVPFAPKLGTLSADYTASCTYKFDYKPGKYPLDCFYCTPFGNYKVYDATDATSSYQDVQGASLNGPLGQVEYLPLHPSFEGAGALFIPVSSALPGKLNLYFQMVSHTNPSGKETGISYYYLSNSSWAPLKIESDTTNSLTCSGIITTQMPDDASSTSELMPAGYQWFVLGVKDDIENRPKTTFLCTNGVLLDRVTSGSPFNYQPQLPAQSLAKPPSNIKEIATVNQFFASFGGRESETISQKNLRVSTRIASKGRLMTCSDYYNVLLQEFSELFYVKVIERPTACEIIILCIPKVESQSDPNAFHPFFSQCSLDKIKSYIKARTSPFQTISTFNFKPEFVRVNAEIEISDKGQTGTLTHEINEKIKRYLSPWIEGVTNSVEIGKGVSTAEIAGLITSIPGINKINSLNIQRLFSDRFPEEISLAKGQEIHPSGDNVLLVPSMFNQIKCVVNEY